mgnify:CR=1 FL=1
MDRSAQKHHTTAASFVYMKTELPLQSLDQQVARLIEQETIEGKPIFVLAGIRGNSGFVLDMIPTRSKESTNPMFLIVAKRMGCNIGCSKNDSLSVSRARDSSEGKC